MLSHDDNLQKKEEEDTSTTITRRKKKRERSLDLFEINLSTMSYDEHVDVLLMHRRRIKSRTNKRTNTTDNFRSDHANKHDGPSALSFAPVVPILQHDLILQIRRRALLTNSLHPGKKLQSRANAPLKESPKSGCAVGPTTTTTTIHSF